VNRCGFLEFASVLFLSGVLFLSDFEQLFGIFDICRIFPQKAFETGGFRIEKVGILLTNFPKRYIMKVTYLIIR
jgi:hypothetical protein